MKRIQKELRMLVIGNEILSGRTADKHIHFVAQQVWKSGHVLREVRVVGDDEKEIGEAVLEMSKKSDLITSGGIGPTHDDITYSSIAKAFGVKLFHHTPTVDAMKRKGMEVNSSRMRMAMFPENSNVHSLPHMWVPIVQMQNVYIFPGVPRLFQNMMQFYLSNILKPSSPALRRRVQTMLKEGDIAEDLERIEKNCNVQIGSYPSEGKDYNVEIVIKGEDAASVDNAAMQVAKSIKGWIVTL